MTIILFLLMLILVSLVQLPKASHLCCTTQPYKNLQGQWWWQWLRWRQWMMMTLMVVLQFVLPDQHQISLLWWKHLPSPLTLQSYKRCPQYIYDQFVKSHFLCRNFIIYVRHTVGYCASYFVFFMNKYVNIKHFLSYTGDRKPYKDQGHFSGRWRSEWDRCG